MNSFLNHLRDAITENIDRYDEIYSDTFITCIFGNSCTAYDQKVTDCVLGMMQSASLSALENLSRLSSKPGVQSTLILSKTNGAIIRSTGLLSASFSLPSESPELGSALAGTDGNRPAPLDEKGGYSSQRAEGNLNAEAVAKMVFSFVSAGGDLANCLEEGGDVQLLRLRTRKNEIVIVPDSKFLLVVIHEASSSA